MGGIEDAAHFILYSLIRSFPFKKDGINQKCLYQNISYKYQQ